MKTDDRWRWSVLIGALMLVTSVAATLLQPAVTQERERDSLHYDLELIVPKSFGKWRVDSELSRFVVSPDIREKLDVSYDRTLSRTYVNDRGEQVMLLVAYGRNQIGGDIQVHRPEGCYAAQGFIIESMQRDVVGLGEKILPIVHLVAKKSRRTEQVTYWARIGNHFVRGYFDQIFARLSAGLTGYHPDGLLFRVSTIGTDPAPARALHTIFIRELMAAIPDDRKSLLIGQ